MASESETAQTPTRSVLERLIISRNRDLSLFLPFLVRLHGTEPDGNTPDPDQNSVDESDPDGQSERIILINPFTQGMVVIEGASLSSLLQADQDKNGRPPASKAAIEAMPTAEIGEDEAGECVICLEELRFGDGVVKEMPCGHRFHGDCVEKWLGFHGSCPICRFEIPSDQEDVRKKSSGDGGERGWRGERGVWVSFTFSGNGRRNTERSSSGDVEQTSSNGGSDDSSLDQPTGSGDSSISD